MERRLITILAADVVGYSALMQRDEAGTFERLKADRRDLIEPKVREFRGHIFKLMGDGFLAEFASVADAVECAVALQQDMLLRNTERASEARIDLRIGINLGDVIIDGDDRQGDGVNIAARLEGIARSGGICISAKVHKEIRGKLALKFEDLGEISLKNIAKPLRAFHISQDGPVAEEDTKAADDEIPSVVILPFTNIGGEPDQQYLSDGISEDIITELSRFHSIRVIARNSAFRFRGLAVDLAEVRRRLGVRYIVEGSLRKIGDRLRINAQLIDATSGSHLWAERFDCALQDVFSLQDQVVTTIASTVEGRAAAAGAKQTQRKPTSQWASYDYFLRGREFAWQYREEEALPFFLRAIEMDPDFAPAHAWCAIALVGCYWFDGKAETLENAQKRAQRALSLDSSDALSHQAMGFVLLHSKQHRLAGMHFERARRLNPADVGIMTDHANWLRYGGRPEEALEILDAAMLRDPYPPVWYWDVRGCALFDLKRYEEAINAFQNMPPERFFIPASLAAAYAMAGQIRRAQEEANLAQRLKPDLSISDIAAFSPYANETLLAPFLQGLRIAGFPES
ncbi:adenylate/guanylate cyclase domain-containing protein [Taklimakanibacter deserti]|uniref:adenylate/guanylate cyclase domain-containing protein n=1 Tax=Taklimakanibacter deserti TaxID=2267839 RepID=UPI0013C42E42